MDGYLLVFSLPVTVAYLEDFGSCLLHRIVDVWRQSDAVTSFQGVAQHGQSCIRVVGSACRSPFF